MAKDVREWFDEAVLTVGSPLRLGQTVDQRKALLFENEVQHDHYHDHDHDVYHNPIFIVSITYFLSSFFRISHTTPQSSSFPMFLLPPPATLQSLHLTLPFIFLQPILSHPTQLFFISI
jgi:hypothetical protein